MTSDFRASSLDHVALWVSEREALAAFLCDHLGMHAIERTDAFTLLGVDAKLGKVTLFDAEGPRERGALGRIVLRVGDLQTALAQLPEPPAQSDGATAEFDAPGDVPFGLVEVGGSDYDLDHVVLGMADPDAAIAQFERLGFERHNGEVRVADRHVRIEHGSRSDGGRPLLNHLALLVDDAHAVQRGAEARGLEIDDVKDAPNTFAVFVRGPEDVRVEYVEHKPGFSLT
jgi:catechol 2,3-dioxygenase-like lactoylglutathione lyase family enzyme